MTRRDAHLDAMFRHLGAAYYESQHGRASSADVARALAQAAAGGGLHLTHRHDAHQGLGGGLQEQE